MDWWALVPRTEVEAILKKSTSKMIRVKVLIKFGTNYNKSNLTRGEKTVIICWFGRRRGCLKPLSKIPVPERANYSLVFQFLTTVSLDTPSSYSSSYFRIKSWYRNKVENSEVLFKLAGTKIRPKDRKMYVTVRFLASSYPLFEVHICRLPISYTCGVSILYR